jgi:hypothetical protein
MLKLLLGFHSEGAEGGSSSIAKGGRGGPAAARTTLAAPRRQSCRGHRPMAAVASDPADQQQVAHADHSMESRLNLRRHLYHPLLATAVAAAGLAAAQRTDSTRHAHNRLPAAARGRAGSR